MRYTTIIDISEMPSIYKNVNARLVYLHLALKSGYHDHDRDLVHISIRRLASDLGLSIAAIRHALHILESAQLLTRQGPLWSVKKWIIEQQITPRAKTAKQKRMADIAAERRYEQQRREQEEAEHQREIDKAYKQGKTPFMIFFEGLQKKAAAGDLEAAESIKKYQSMYNNHVAAQSRKNTQDKP